AKFLHKDRLKNKFGTKCAKHKTKQLARVQAAWAKWAIIGGILS
ncbi:hypothetical protein HMPREF9098_1649, partial [Kingella denitrificans ATCC 33394]